jgi:CRP/FNR family transcriptional regulator, cyclic AMP receptor protein
MEWPLLAGLDDPERERVLAAARRSRFARGDVLFWEGDPAHALHLIEVGTVAARVETLSGDSVAVQVLGRGEVVGELALVAAPVVRTASVYALEPTETLALPRVELEAIRARYPSVDRVLVEILAAKLARLSMLMGEARSVGADKRVLRRLLDLVPVFGLSGKVIVVPVGQGDLAGLAGTTRETVNRTLRTAEDAGLLRLARGRIDITDIRGLADRAGD